MHVVALIGRWLPVKDLLSTGLHRRPEFRFRLLHAAYLRLTWPQLARFAQRKMSWDLRLFQHRSCERRAERVEPESVLVTGGRLHPGCGHSRFGLRQGDLASAGEELLSSVRKERGWCDEAQVFVELADRRLQQSSQLDGLPPSSPQDLSTAFSGRMLPFCVAFVQANFMPEAKDAAERSAVAGWLRRGLPLGPEARAVCAKAVEPLAGRPTNVWGHLAAQSLLLCQVGASRLKTWISNELADLERARGVSSKPLEEPLELYRALRSVKEVWMGKVVECLYLLATLLLALHRRYHLSDRLHYGLAAALRFYEEDAELPPGGQGSNALSAMVREAKGMRLTGEQRRIVGLPLESWSEGAEGKTFRVVAFAGSGKTHTLLHFVKAHPEQRFLMLMFNTAARTEAESKFAKMKKKAASEGAPIGHVHIANHHSFAYNYRLKVDGKPRVAGKLFGRMGNLQHSDVLKFFKQEFRGQSHAVRVLNEPFKDMDKRLGIGKSASERRRRERNAGQEVLGKLVVRTVEVWFGSADEELGLRHVPERAQDADEEDAAEAGPHAPADWAPVSAKDRDLVLDLALLLWEAMSRPRPFSAHHDLTPMSHNGLLKFVLLRLKRLSDSEELELNADRWFPELAAEVRAGAEGVARARGFDAVLVDEAQDSNPAVLRWLFAQTDVHRILVGDPAQAIYKFIGAVDALSEVERLDPACVTLPLTRSFRFGPRIGWLANAWLWAHCGQRRHLLLTNALEGRLDGVRRPNQDVAILCRTNQRALCAAFDVVREHPEAKLRALGRLAKDKSAWLKSIHELVLCRTGQGPRLAELFPDTKEKDNVGKSTAELALAARKGELVRQQNIAIAAMVTEDLVERLKKAFARVKDSGQSYVVCTAHSAKGLEFDSVILADDFVDPAELRGSAKAQEEANLLYVAMTRAKRSLQLPALLHAFVNRRLRDEWLDLRLTRRLSRDPGLACNVCQAAMRPCGPDAPLLTLHRDRVAIKGYEWGHLHQRSSVKPGPLCAACARGGDTETLAVELGAASGLGAAGLPALLHVGPFGQSVQSVTRHALAAFLLSSPTPL